MTKETAEGTKLLMRRLAGALVSWLTFQQAAKRSIMYDEYFMYTPIFELVTARKWRVVPQFSYKNSKGRWPRFDFVFFRTAAPEGDRVAALEVSYIRPYKNRAGKKCWKKPEKIKNDEEKLKSLKTNDFLGGKHGAIKRYVLIAGKENDLKEYCKNHFGRAVPLLTNKAKSNANTAGRKTDWIYRSAIKFKACDDDKGRYSTCWCVMVLSVSAK